MRRVCADGSLRVRTENGYGRGTVRGNVRAREKNKPLYSTFGTVVITLTLNSCIASHHLRHHGAQVIETTKEEENEMMLLRRFEPDLDAPEKHPYAKAPRSRIDSPFLMHHYKTKQQRGHKIIAERRKYKCTSLGFMRSEISYLCSRCTVTLESLRVSFSTASFSVWNSSPSAGYKPENTYKSSKRRGSADNGKGYKIQYNSLSVYGESRFTPSHLCTIMLIMYMDHCTRTIGRIGRKPGSGGSSG